MKWTHASLPEGPSSSPREKPGGPGVWGCRVDHVLIELDNKQCPKPNGTSSKALHDSAEHPAQHIFFQECHAWAPAELLSCSQSSSTCSHKQKSPLGLKQAAC